MLKLKPWTDNRPVKRSDCYGRPRPCPWVGCKNHLFWELPKVKRKLRSDAIVEIIIKMNPSCYLDVCDRGATLDEIGQLWGLTRERVRQIESGVKGKKGGALKKLRRPQRSKLLEGFMGE